MTYSTLNLGNPKKEVKISKLGFGTMRFPEKDGIIDQEQVNEMVKYAFDNGVNYFDTAYLYDGSEVALGKAIKQLNREDIFIADKMPFWSMDSEEYLDKTFKESLNRVDTDYFDFYLMHYLCKPNVKKLREYNAVEFAKKMKAEGKIKYLGFSIHDDYEVLLECLDLADWDFVQIQYNYLDKDGAPGQKGYDELVRRGIPIVIMEPLKGGILSDLPDTITEPYQKLGGSNVEYAFRWLAEQDNIKIILSGMSNMEQMTQNIELFGDIKPLTQGEHSAIEEVVANVKKYQKVPCTGCNYCMPCPAKVKIPSIFKAWNTKSMPIPHNGWVTDTIINYKSAGACVDCMACVKKCPQQIDIPAKLKQVIAER